VLVTDSTILSMMMNIIGGRVERLEDEKELLEPPKS
jgi:hypothetical protein